jgi:Family of unknown function (DUF5335)
VKNLLARLGLDEQVFVSHGRPSFSSVHRRADFSAHHCARQTSVQGACSDAAPRAAERYRSCVIGNNEDIMRTAEIPREAWTSTLDGFSAMHDGWLVSLDVTSLSIGAQPELDNLPLVGVSAEPVDRGGTITIAAGSAAGGYVAHTIHAPSRVLIERRDDGADVAMQIESADGTKAILRFRAVALPETVDGVAH